MPCLTTSGYDRIQNTTPRQAQVSPCLAVLTATFRDHERNVHQRTGSSSSVVMSARKHLVCQSVGCLCSKAEGPIRCMPRLLPRLAEHAVPASNGIQDGIRQLLRLKAQLRLM